MVELATGCKVLGFLARINQKKGTVQQESMYAIPEGIADGRFWMLQRLI
jgi:hypothetical protein